MVILVLPVQSIDPDQTVRKQSFKCMLYTMTKCNLGLFTYRSLTRDVVGEEDL